MADSTAPIPRSMVLAVLAATMVAQLISTMSIAIFPVIAPRLAMEMGIAPAMIGYQVSLIFGAATLASTVMGSAVVRWGACRATQISLALCVAAMALALISSLWALALTSILVGVSMALLTPASGHLLFRFSPPKNRNFVFSIKQSGVPLGWMVMALVAPVITIAFGWRWAVAGVLVVTLAAILALQHVRSRWDDDRKPQAAVWASPAAGLKLAWRYPVLRWLAAASCALAFTQLCLGTFLVTMLVEEAGYSLVAAGVMLALVQAAGGAGRVASGWLGDRTGNTLGVLKIMAMTTTGCCIVTAFLDPAWPTVLVALLFLVFGTVAVGWNGLFLAEVARCSPPGMVSIATSGAMTWNFGGILLGPALFATVYALSGSYTLTYGGLSAIPFLGFVALTLCGRAARRSARAGE